MKAIWQRGFFEIIFEESDKYAGKMLTIDGQNGLNNDFYILPKPKMYWVDDKNHKCEYVDPNEYEDVLAYVLEKMKDEDQQYSFIVYNR